MQAVHLGDAGPDHLIGTGAGGVLCRGGGGFGLGHVKERRTACVPEDERGAVGGEGRDLQPLFHGAQVAVAPDQHLRRAIRADGAGLDPRQWAGGRGGAARPVLIEITRGGDMRAQLWRKAGGQSIAAPEEQTHGQ